MAKEEMAAVLAQSILRFPMVPEAHKESKKKTNTKTENAWETKIYMKVERQTEE